VQCIDSIIAYLRQLKCKFSAAFLLLGGLLRVLRDVGQSVAWVAALEQGLNEAHGDGLEVLASPPQARQELRRRRRGAHAGHALGPLALASRSAARLARSHVRWQHVEHEVGLQQVELVQAERHGVHQRPAIHVQQLGLGGGVGRVEVRQAAAERVRVALHVLVGRGRHDAGAPRGEEVGRA